MENKNQKEFLIVRGEQIKNTGLEGSKPGDEYSLIVTFSSDYEVKLNFKKINK